MIRELTRTATDSQRTVTSLEHAIETLERRRTSAEANIRALEAIEPEAARIIALELKQADREAQARDIALILIGVLLSALVSFAWMLWQGWGLVGSIGAILLALGGSWLIRRWRRSAA